MRRAPWFLLLLLPVLLPRCRPSPEPSAAEVPDPGKLSAADSAAVLQGGEIAGRVAQGLVQRLQATLADGGPAGAVEFCAGSALALTDSLTAGLPGVAAKRTSLRVRNPANRPDSLERVALAWYDSVQAAGGALPARYLQPAGEHELRYYRPLVVQSFCLQCHGASEQIAPAVQTILAQRYPADSATGYREGDLRGLLRVSVARPLADVR